MDKRIKRILELCKVEVWSRDYLLQQLWELNKAENLGIKDVRVVLDYAESMGYLIKKSK